MRIAVDTRMIAKGGIGTYVSQLLPRLEQSSHTFERLELSSPIYSLREQIELPLKVPACDLYWAPHFNVPLLPVKASTRIVTVHDLFHLDHLQTLSFAKWLYAKTVLQRAITQADQLITVSNFSKSRLLHYFPELVEKITVIHSGCDHLSAVVPMAIGGIPPSFFLCVGNSKPHKNRALLFAAMQEFSDIHLVLVGPAEEYDKQLEGRVHFLHSVSEEELAWLYKNAEALLFPSLYEGWGLPPLEAMQLGCPVIASRAASIPEACGEGALYFDPSDANELCEKIGELSKKRDNLISAGKNRAAQFSWRGAAESHLQVFERALSLQ